MKFLETLRETADKFRLKEYDVTFRNKSREIIGGYPYRMSARSPDEAIKKVAAELFQTPLIPPDLTVEVKEVEQSPKTENP